AAESAEPSGKPLDAVVSVAVFTRRLVVNRPAGADHGPGRSLVSKAHPRSEGVLSGFPEAGPAASSRALAGKLHRTRNAAGAGVRKRRVEVAVLVIRFLFRDRKVVAEAEVQRQPAV